MKPDANKLIVAGLHDAVQTKRQVEQGDERNIGSRVKEVRESLGLNFEQLAALTREYDDAGIAAVTLRRYERTDEGGSLPCGVPLNRSGALAWSNKPRLA